VRTERTALQKSRNLFGYGVGDFGLNIYWQTIAIFLLYWYTKVAGVDPRWAGLIFFIGMAWDAISDPIVASLAERVETKYGTYRPFLLFCAPITAFAFTLLFWVPPWEGAAKIGILILTCLVFRTAYTITAIPYAAMASRITYDSTERAEYSGARMFFGFFALVLVSMFLSPLVAHFTTELGSPEKAFQLTAALGGILATLAIWACFMMTREKPLPVKTRQSENIWTGIWMNVTSNKALQILLGLIVLNTAAATALAATLLFYIEANQNIFAKEEILLSTFAIVTWLMIPVWTYLIKVHGRKKVWIGTSLVHVLLALHMTITGPIIMFGVPVHIIAFMALMGAHAIIFWALVPDCVEFGQIDSGYRSEAGVFGSVLITQKFSGGLMVLGFGFVLSAMGVQKDAPVTADQADGLGLFIALCPAVLVLFTIIPILLIPMTRSRHDNIIGELS